MGGPRDSLEERISGSRVKAWFLLELNRRLLAAVLLAAFYLALVAVITLWPAGIRAVLSANTPARSLFQALVTALITAVTLVITINQLVLSQELGALDDQRERMQGAVEFRHDVQEYLSEPASPAEPASFLQCLVAASKGAAQDLRAALSDHPDADLREAVDEYVDDLVENAEAVTDQLEDAQFGRYGLVSAAVDYNYSWKLYRAEYLQSEYEASLDDDQREAFETLIETLQFFAPAREHFKTLYFQWELTDLSRGMLYTALPALIVAVGALVFLDEHAVLSGATLGVENVTWVLAGAVTITVVPFVILISYVLRIATVAKHTLAMGPFVLRADERTGEDPDAGD
jgi:hypothetical protein